MDFSLYRTIEPTELPVTLREAKQQVEIPDSTNSRDEQLLLLMSAATRRFENFTRRSMMPQTWVYERTEPVRAIELPRPPFVAITTVESRELLTDAWSAVDAADYSIESNRSPAQLTWVDQMPRRIRVTYQTGYADRSKVPSDYKLSILQLVAHFLENRGDAGADLPISLVGMLESQRAGTRTGYWYA